MSMRPLIESIRSLIEAKKDKDDPDLDYFIKAFGKEHLAILPGGRPFLKRSYFTAKGEAGPNPVGELGAAFWASDKSAWGKAERDDEGIEYDPNAWFDYLSRGPNGRFLKKIWPKIKNAIYGSPKWDKESVTVSIFGADKNLMYLFDVYGGKNDVDIRNVRIERQDVDWRFNARESTTVKELMKAVG
jgi:hypothetical protein